MELMWSAGVFLLSVKSFFGAHGITWEDVWLPIALVAAFTVFAYYNIILMLARSFRITEMERQAKSEMLQATATAVMAIFLVTLVYGAMEFVYPYLHGELRCGDENLNIGTSNETAINEALDGIRCQIQNKAGGIADLQGELTSGGETWGYFTLLGLDVSIFGLTIFKGDWLTDIYKETEQRRIVNNLATSILISLNAQSYLIMYIKANMLNIFLPVGILLRAFQFTRSAGAFFISLAIGLYFVFPVVYVLMDPGFTPIPITPSPPATPEQFCYPTMGFATTIMQTAQTSGATTGMGALETANLKDSLAKAYVSIMIHPLVSLLLTLVFVRYLMTVLGGDTYELVKLATKVI